MKQTTVTFNHPDDVNGQKPVILVQSALTEYARDCETRIDGATTTDDRAEMNDETT